MILDYFANKYSWRHFELPMQDGGDDGGGDSGFPFGPGDRAGSSQPPSNNNPPPSGGGYPTGPPPYQRPTASAPPDPWAGIPGAVHDQAVALVEKFLAAAGWPQGVDANRAALLLAYQSGVNLTGSPFDAYRWVFMNVLNEQQRQASPWAEFGMLKDEYGQTVSKMNGVMFDWTGNQLDADTLKDAIRGAWTPDQIRNFAMYGNPEGTGQLLSSAQLSGDMPWLSQGSTYAQALQGFQSFEQHAPPDKQTLAAWFRFGVSARHIGGGTGAQTSVQRQLVSAGSEVR